MDCVPSLVNASESSSCSQSTGLLTPDSSPLFLPAHPKDSVAARLSKFLDDSKPHRPGSPETRLDSLLGPSYHDFLVSEPVRRVCVIGAGYVGGPTAAVIALHNPAVHVEVVDKDPRRIQKWKSAHLPIREPGLNRIVRLTRDGAAFARPPRDQRSASQSDDSENDGMLSGRAPNLFFTTDSLNSISNADMIFLAVNTPTKTTGVGAGRATNMAALDGAVKEVANHAKPGTVIVEKSTVPCGTAKRIRQMLDTLRPGVPFEVLSNPEFLSEGSAVQNLMRPDRVLIGSSSATPAARLAVMALASLYASWIPRTQILQVNAWSSELAKLVANAMLAQRISSINSISAICEATGANVDEVATAVGRDARIGPQFLKAGLGFGGSCFRKDIASLTYLAESLGLDDVAHYWAQVNSINGAQRRRFANKVLKRFNENLVGKKISLLGFAFKRNTGDARESPAVDVIKTLLDEQPAEIAIFDPYCDEADILREINNGVVCMPTTSSDPLDIERCPIKIYSDVYQACSEANAVLIITDNEQFRNDSGPRRRQHNRSPTAFTSTSAWTPVPTTTNRRSRADTTTATDPGPLSAQKTEDEDEEDAVTAWLASYVLTPAPTCPADCADCRTAKSSSRTTSTEPVEWARIVYSMREPKWIFDGRNVLNVPEMEKLGVCVEAVGSFRPDGGGITGDSWCL